MDDKWHMSFYRFWHLYIYKHQLKDSDSWDKTARGVMLEIDTLLAENLNYRNSIYEKSENECPL